MLSETIQEKVKEVISAHTGEEEVIKKTSSIGGGCINDAHRVDTHSGRYFVKYNHARRYPGMFEVEAKGLQILREVDAVYVPEVIGHDAAQDISVLVLEFIDENTRQSDFWEAFGEGLARLHQNQHQEGKFGLDHDNYIGSLTQQNRYHDSWPEFFVNERINPQLKMARDQGKAGQEMVQLFDKMATRIPDFFPEEPPALIHGDLWSGNYMVGNQGQAVIIDPAVYYGHRYMDLAMSKLFGGFNAPFYEAYNNAYPLEPSWQQSMDIANLYPLMVHVNLFGGGYAGSVKSILRKFV